MRAVMVAERPPSRGSSPLLTRIDRLPRIWPLAVVVMGYPLWWLLGVASFMPFAMAAVMAWQLRGLRHLLIPQGLGWWLVFMVWVCLGVFVLYTNAPGAVPGGGAGRILVFAYNLGLYLVCTVAVAWVFNSTEAELPTSEVSRVLSWMFVFTTAGGLAGTVLASVDFPSLLEVVLPKSLAQNSFVASQIHPGLSDIQDVLGTPEARPKAPFAYANTWGSVMALSLPFFLDTWLRRGGRLRRLVGVGILVSSLVPIVYSLNRGLWGCLAVGVVILVLLQAKDGRFGTLAVLGGVLAVAAVAFLASPLGDVVGDRFEHQHSNDRREQLLVQTVVSALEGSPIIGFGGTRDVQGSFASIAGTSTEECPACGVPPLGTQGHLWFVIFAQGLVGAALFLAFFLSSLFRTWRCRTTSESFSTTLVVFFLVQMFVYDTLGVPLLLVMVAIGLGWRAVSARGELSVRTLRYWLDALRDSRRTIIALAIVGGAIGGTLALFPRTTYEVKEYVLLAPSPSYLQTDANSDDAPRDTTIDTEAALVMSEQTLAQVDSSATAQWRLRSDLTVTAIPNTQVLVISLQSEDVATLPALADRISNAYLSTRQAFLENRRTQLLATLQARAAELDSLGVTADSTERESIDDAISTILLTTTTAGSTLRTDPPTEVPRAFPQFVGSGIGVGLIVSLLWMELVVRRRFVLLRSQSAIRSRSGAPRKVHVGSS
ncbi:MAG: hypothetical protein QM779_10365 [Propionicimonas sp.]|uniref:O-antigen ligase family protein n=1 Tax=Propionicimonas sp. TaxID=1955623 RepID=UPI003D14DB31